MNLAGDLAERFDALFPRWPSVVAVVIALIILLIVMTFLLYKPVKKMHDNRRNYIQNNINEAERLSSEARQERERAQQEVLAAHLEASEIVAAARVEAQDVRHELMTATNEEINHLKAVAENDIESQQKKFEIESKKAIVEIAMAAAAEVVGRVATPTTTREIVNEYLEAESNER